MSVDPSLINQDLLIAAANVCDEAMALREGGYQPRYACGGVVEATMNRGQVIQKLLDAMSGTLVPPGSEWKIFAGAPVDSTLSITDGDLRGPIKLDAGVSRKDLVNGAKGTYISPANNWQASDYPPYVNQTYVEDDGGTVTLVGDQYSYTGVVYVDLALDFVSDPVQAQRLAKIKVEKARRAHPLILPCKMMAYPVEVHDTISFTHARWGLSAATYEVTNTALVYDDKGGAAVLGYDLVCVPTDSTVYEWDPDVDEGTVTIVTAPLLPDNSNVGPPLGIGSPPELGLESDASTTIVRADGVAHSQIKVTWGLSTDAHVLNGGYYEIFIKEISDPNYLFAGSVAGNVSTFFIDTNITDGIDYDVMVQSLNAAGSHSDGISGSVVCGGSASTIGGSGPGPVNVFNNDFEASSSLPPANWTVIGSPTLTYDISSQQQGLRSLVIASHVKYEGVQSQAKYSVVPGDQYTGEQYKVGGYMKGDGTGHAVIVFDFYDLNGDPIGTSVVADGGNPTPAEWEFYSAVDPVPEEAIFARVACRNYSTTGVSCSLEFDSIVLFRVASLEDEVVNGPSRGAITAANSSYRPLTNPLTAHYDGALGSPPTDECEIDIAAFTMRSAIGPTDMSVNSGVISGLACATTYHVYYDDPTYLGGAVTYYANTTQAVALDAEGRFYVGSILTPVPGGIDTIGNNDGGTGAQSGQLYQLSPTLRADNTTTPPTWYPANEAETDGDTSTYYDLTNVETIWLGGIPTTYTKWTSVTLKLCTQVLSVTPGGAAFCDYSLDDGVTWTNIFNVALGSDQLNGASTGAQSGSGASWTNPGNAADPTNYATIVGMAHGASSKQLQGTSFGNTIPAGSTIDGFTIYVDEMDGGTAEPAEAGSFLVQMLKAGTPVGDPKPANALGTGTIQLGNNDDLWGTTWADIDPNDTNFGFQVQALTPVARGAWTNNTYYSPMALIIDSNGNYQIVVTPGTSGATHPSWSSTLSATTPDGSGSLVWACYQHSSTWAAGQAWNPGDPNYAPNASLPDGSTNTPHFITATAGGVSCVFELTEAPTVRLGNVEAYTFPTNGDQKGSCNLPYPSGNPPAAATGSFAPVSLHWSSLYTGSPYEMYQYTVNPDGSLGTKLDLGKQQNWQSAIAGQLVFSKKGTYVFNLQHDDGAVIAMDTSVIKVVSVPRGVGNVYMGSRAPVTGLPWIAGSNASTNYSTSYDSYSIPPGPYSPYNVYDEEFTISVPNDDTVVQFEINYTNWEHEGHMILLWKDANGNWQDLVPSSTPAKTSATQPTWPAWSTSHAPASWPSVVEANGQFIWVNRGPATDFAWHGNCNIAAADTGVISASGYGQLPYRAGVSGSSAPAFSSTTNALTSEGASLVW
jgi:hypothetical protein